MKRFVRYIFLTAALLGSSNTIAGTLTMKGSDTMVILGQRWAEEFMKNNPGTTVQVTGGGSGTGISALINGTTDICQSSRSIKPSEREKLRERYNTPGMEIPVARDGLAVYVNATNPVKTLTMEELRRIYTGKITNWKEVGGTDSKMIVYSRENSSGTYVFFKEHVLNNGDYTPRVQSMQGTAAVVSAVSKEKNGIGYGGAAYAKGITVLNVKKDAASPGVLPNQVNVMNGSYPLSRPLFFYLRNKPNGETKTFIDWVLSPEGQTVVTTVGYFPVQ